MLKGRPLKAVLGSIKEQERAATGKRPLYEQYMHRVGHPFGHRLPPEKIERTWGRYLCQARLAIEIDAAGYYRFVLGHGVLCTLCALCALLFLSGVVKAAVLFMCLYLAVFPMVWLKEKAGLRTMAIKREMPSIIMVVAITMEAGAGLNQAIREITRVKSGEFVKELTYYLEALEMGHSRKEALSRMSEQLMLIEVTQLTAMLEESLEKGADGLSEALKGLSETLWDQRVERAKVLASKASAKLFLPLLLLVFPAMMIFILSPAVFSIMKHFGG